MNEKPGRTGSERGTCSVGYIPQTICPGRTPSIAHCGKESVPPELQQWRSGMLIPFAAIRSSAFRKSACCSCT
ncbi:MAG: hypothetical protein PHX00_08275 [Synergistaceae bacterium]|nr:hypothetical protein [Synergistaceae bacterium]